MKRTVQVCLTPALLHLHDLHEKIVVVIDILRATSSMTYGLQNGAKAIIPVSQVEDCLAFSGSDYLLAAERNGEVVSGFDFGNSPFSYTAEKVADKTIVLTTTNGTKALHMARATAFQVLVGSFLNLDALVSYLESQPRDVVLLCAGWKDNFNLEDTLFAGAVVMALKGKFGHFDDACVAAEDMYSIAQADLRGYLRKSSHSHRLEQLNIEEDVLFCLRKNICTVIPVLIDQKLVPLTI
ncbi:MAG: 2-phosphosulfolactate phosphatase [Pedobacter sp.]|nr:MAG: 2-phosphosulfolactate phosphatase [Pedobacter sp.]